jgi:hypothetical protein
MSWWKSTVRFLPFTVALCTSSVLAITFSYSIANTQYVAYVKYLQSIGRLLAGSFVHGSEPFVHGSEPWVSLKYGNSVTV